MDADHSTIDEREMPSRVAEQFAVALGLEQQPDTLGDWVDGTAKRLEAAGITFGVDEMCLTDSSPHRAQTDGETRYFACVLDALLLPFLLDDFREVEVRTKSPVSDSATEVRVSETDIVVEPSGAVMSFGIAGDTTPPDSRDGVLGFGTAQFCPYINAFVDEAEYDRWAEETPEAVTMPLPLEDGFELASALRSKLPSGHS